MLGSAKMFMLSELGSRRRVVAADVVVCGWVGIRGRRGDGEEGRPMPSPLGIGGDADADAATDGFLKRERTRWIGVDWTEWFGFEVEPTAVVAPGVLGW